ncbi:MAG: CU044_2847 family protein [Cyanobacteria bacterium P01_F01_bin.56]
MRDRPPFISAMPSDIIQTVTSSEESIVLFEMKDPRGSTTATARHPQELAAKSAQALGQAMGTIQALANRTAETLAKLPKPPDTCEVEFGIKVDPQVGALVSDAADVGNLRIKFVWSSDRQADSTASVC